MTAGQLRKIRVQAAEWVVALAEHDPPDEKLVHAHAQWCATDSVHQATYLEVAQLWRAATPELLNSAGMISIESPPRKKTRANKLLNPLLGLALVLGVCWLALPPGVGVSPMASYLADQRTGAGEVRKVELDDGSTVTLNTRSAVDIDYTASRRTLRLRQGEVLVEVAKDGRPFEVLGRDGAVRALGTRYAVRQGDADSRVTVEESTVQISPTLAPDARTSLAAGQTARFDAARVMAPQDSAGMNANSWAKGVLVFNDTPLPQVLSELARYRAGVLDVDDRALQDLRFTGVLPVADQREALALLVDALPIRVTFYTHYLALVRLNEKNEKK